MNEPPGARARVALSRAHRRRVLPRRRGAGRAPLRRQHLPLHAGRLGSVGAPRPHPERRRLPADALDRDGRAPGAHHVDEQGLDHVSVQAIYVPADDLTDPAPATTFAHLDATTVLSRAIAELGIYPAVDPLDSTSTMLDPQVIGERHYDVAREVQQTLSEVQGPAGHHRHPRHGRAQRGRQARRRARAQDPALPLAAVLRRRAVHRPRRASTSRSRTPSAASRRSSPASYDDLPEQAFYLVGNIEEVKAKAREARAARARSPMPRSARDASRRSGPRAQRREVDEVTAPSVAGEFGVLPGHLPFLAALKAGMLELARQGRLGRARDRRRLLRSRRQGSHRRAHAVRRQPASCPSRSLNREIARARPPTASGSCRACPTIDNDSSPRDRRTNRRMTVGSDAEDCDERPGKAELREREEVGARLDKRRPSSVSTYTVSRSSGFFPKWPSVCVATALCSAAKRKRARRSWRSTNCTSRSHSPHTPS